eukprot:TRINITY_DN2243_c0_g1_i1.p1 TRINITY_DN2243_c0_g1~~TRINITY_DN2243_c0_g1_i1.p1  ORF type:complete len:413 (-),score=109.07 TRINITY_DN2243_c0_g1_i1:26-1264(-)
MEYNKKDLGVPLHALSVRGPIPESIRRSATSLTSPYPIICVGGGGGGAAVGSENSLTFFKVVPQGDGCKLDQWFKHTIDEESLPASFAVDPFTNDEFLVALSCGTKCKTLNFAAGGQAVTIDEKVTIESNDEDVGQDYVGYLEGNKLVTGGGDGRIQIWNWNDFTLDSTFVFGNPQDDDDSTLLGVETHSDNLIITCTNRFVKIFQKSSSTNNWTCKATIVPPPHPETPNQKTPDKPKNIFTRARLSFSNPSSPTLFILESSTLRKSTTFLLAYDISPALNSSSPSSLSPFARIVAHSGWRNVGRGQSLAVSDDGKILATGTGRGEIAVWDVKGREIGCRWWGTVHGLWVTDLVIVKPEERSGGDYYVVSCSADHFISCMRVKQRVGGRKKIVVAVLIVLLAILLSWILGIF